MTLNICSITELADAASYDAASLKIDSHRVEKLSRIKSKNDRMRSVCAGLLLNFAVAEYKRDADCRREAEETVQIKCGEAQVMQSSLFEDFRIREISLKELLSVEKQEYAYVQKGNEKPYLSNLPDFRFSLSHSGDYVLCAWDLHEIGADLQCMDREVKDTLAKRVMTEEEYKTYTDLPKQKQKEEFYRVWAIKESYCKLTGKGVSQDFRAIETDKISYQAVLWKEKYWLAVSQFE